MSGRHYVVTWAQNATLVHQGFLKALHAYSEFKKAELLVLAGRYRNPTSIWTDADRGHDWYDPSIAPHLVRAPRQLSRSLIVHGGVHIQPTAERPLTGWEAYAGSASAIFGHPKIQMTTVPRAYRLPRIFITTGACTVADNYTDSKAGKKGQRHHVLGACAVRVEEDGTYHIRPIYAEGDGSFQDLESYYTPDGVTEAPRPLAAVLGDWHAAKQTEQSIQDAVDFLSRIKPRALVLHDVLDFATQSHHEKARWWVKRPRDVSQELRQVVGHIRDLAFWVDDLYVVGSNHDRHLDRWLEKFPSEDPPNCEIWIKLWSLYYGGDRGSALARFCRHVGVPGNVHFVAGESLSIGSYECSYHGDRGVNGSRGSLTQYAKLGSKVIVGHSHGPGILGGATQVGVSAPLGSFSYRKGAPDPSLNTHGLIYENGKRTLITVLPGGRF